MLLTSSAHANDKASCETKRTNKVVDVVDVVDAVAPPIKKPVLPNTSHAWPEMGSARPPGDMSAKPDAANASDAISAVSMPETATRFSSAFGVAAERMSQIPRGRSRAEMVVVHIGASVETAKRERV